MVTAVYDFVRHGEPVGGRRIRGHGQDDPLSEAGWRQMRAIPIGGYTHVVTSPLRRCYEFAVEVGRTRGLTVLVEARWQEIGFGVWEGMQHADVAARDPAFYAEFLQNPVDKRPDGAEPLLDFANRVNAAWAEQTAELTHEERVLVVTHAGVMRVLLLGFLAGDLNKFNQIDIPYARCMRWRWDDVRGWQLAGVNLA